ncbi:serine/threonine-protein kinase [Sandaracinus amylolyticus]|uniref:Serine/threonine protein kinase n=1 Tax=Sandaracinus amylolyticus TaxID=927083 RepID=A0A0F6VZN4_9BACT|nr:serine/threonine-protein kinase [Sandaracinus amylolyticus]AKF03731.1 Serine/threonine protein kinase [Sandaracinus amylolyticus]
MTSARATSEPIGALPEGTRFGRYRTVARIGGGGMAEVYLASLVGELGFAQSFVLKRILPELAGDERFVAMLADEARLAAHVRHRSVAQVIELVSTPELAIVMELVEGETLAGLLRATAASGVRLPVHVIAYVVAEIAAGLHAAHTIVDGSGAPLNLVHRDVSPSNVMITLDGSVKLLDFGVAAAEGRLARTRTGELKGKLAYTAPEALDGGRPDARWDVFSLGCVLWEALTGERLFKRESEAATIRAVLDGEIAAPSVLAPDVTPALDRACLAALARDPAARTSSMAELRAQLLPFVTSSSADDAAALLRAHCRARLDAMAALRRGADTSFAPIAAEGESRVRITQSGRARSNRGWWLAALAVVAFAAVGGVLAARATPAAVVPVASTTMAVPPPIVSASPSPERASPSDERESPPPAPVRAIRVSSTPRAEVREGDVVLGRTPLSLDVATPREITLHQPRFRPARVRLSPSSPESVEVTLSRARGGQSRDDYDLWD